MTFPTDRTTLALLRFACMVNPDTGRSHLHDFLSMGSVERSRERIADDVVFVDYSRPPWSEHEVILALVDEVERLRYRAATTALDDRVYLDLKGARERLCRAQTHVPPHWRNDLQVALDRIDVVGSAVCADRWSRFDQPEYPEANEA